MRYLRLDHAEGYLTLNYPTANLNNILARMCKKPTWDSARNFGSYRVCAKTSTYAKKPLHMHKA